MRNIFILLALLLSPPLFALDFDVVARKDCIRIMKFAVHGPMVYWVENPGCVGQEWVTRIMARPVDLSSEEVELHRFDGYFIISSLSADADHIYWGNNTQGLIQRIHTQSRTLKTVVTLEDSYYPQVLADGKNLWWTDKNNLRRMDLASGEVQEMKGPFSVHRELLGTEEGVYFASGFVGDDFSVYFAPKDGTAVRVILKGWPGEGGSLSALRKNGNCLYWATHAEQAGIWEYDLDTRNLRQMVKDLRYPDGMTVDREHVYYGDGQQFLYRLNKVTGETVVIAKSEVDLFGLDELVVDLGYLYARGLSSVIRVKL